MAAPDTFKQCLQYMLQVAVANLAGDQAGRRQLKEPACGSRHHMVHTRTSARMHIGELHR